MSKPTKRSLYEQDHVWVVEIWNETPSCRPYWGPCVGISLDREGGRLRMRQWKSRNPDDRFRLTKYRRVI